MNRAKTIVGRTLLWAVGLMIVGSLGVTGSWARNDPAKIIGPEDGTKTCHNCHGPEVAAWRQTTHFKTYVDRAESDEAETILENMGEDDMEESEYCTQCHYTLALDEDDDVEVIAGISCESCHGAAKGWNGTHNKLDGTTLSFGDGCKDPAGREKRLGPARADGMIDSKMTYEIATNCFGCHTVPNETLVNQGKHPAGSDFDLVAWSQGEVRHNYLCSEDGTNEPAPPEQLRRLYVVGAMVDLETSLRNLIEAEDKSGDYGVAMAERVKRARMKMDAILAEVDIAGLQAVVSEASATAMDSALPGKLGAATKAFAKTSVDLSGIDSQIPTKMKGTASK